MLSFLYKRVLQRTNLLNGHSKKTPLCFLKYPSLTITHFSVGYSTSQNSFTASYLVKSCGLSEENAISASKEVHFETSTKPDSVLTFFRNNGLSGPHISKIVQLFPPLLMSNVKKTLQPKFDFFNSKGLSGPELGKALSHYPFVLTTSLEKRIIPSFAFLKSIVGTDAQVIALLQRSVVVLREDPQKHLAPNTALLLAHGVPHSNISRLLVSQPRSFLRKPNDFYETVNEVKKMGIDPLKYIFCEAIFRLTSMHKSTLEAKFDVYKRWGWSEEDIHSAFRRVPHLMSSSAEKIMCTMDFLVCKMGYDPLSFTKHPIVLRYSLEKRIVPRCSVIQVLVSNGLIKKDRSLSAFLAMTEKDFLRRVVIKFEVELPELLNIYQGKTS